jgi:hypothetical protein
VMLYPMIKPGDIVLTQGHTSTFKVLIVSADGETADIQFFSLPKQKLLGGVMSGIPCSTLSPFNQPAARIVREATENQ